METSEAKKVAKPTNKKSTTSAIRVMQESRDAKKIEHCPLHPDLKAATMTVEELLEAGGGRSGEALAIRREFFASFNAFAKTHLTAAGKSAAYVAGMIDIVGNVKGIQFQSAGRKTAVKGLIEAYVAAATAEQVSKYEKTIQQVLDAASAADPLDE